MVRRPLIFLRWAPQKKGGRRGKEREQDNEKRGQKRKKEKQEKEGEGKNLTKISLKKFVNMLQ